MNYVRSIWIVFTYVPIKDIFYSMQTITSSYEVPIILDLLSEANIFCRNDFKLVI